MDNATPSGVRALLASRGVQPHKGLGQNFLIDKNILDKIATAAQIAPGEGVVEIGAGLGGLTKFLAPAARKVAAVEIDKKLIPLLEPLVDSYDNVILITGDILTLDWEREIFIYFEDPREKVVICANLPYYITSPIIFKILEHHDRVRQAVLMMQKEVADRLMARPGTSDYGLLTVMVSRKAKVAQVARVSRNCFYPVPDVDSTVVRLIPLDKPSVEVKQEAVFNKLVRAAFQARRKTMHNVLVMAGLAEREAAGDILVSLGIEPQRRGETLTVEEFACIANRLS
ncbi:MAG: 16S rRNA (adenine(1518)-N(6)/adenine(1519)-N(6))-dimethyltransferase RsmA [Syntrophomonadaceae bacterium]|nr:16S rRNA (adenine(1518)-N(6)/adenine(1519)-N(6))-dimethyltransferase RsmA [Syntrophomonadaceae bacterium]